MEENSINEEINEDINSQRRSENNTCSKRNKDYHIVNDLSEDENETERKPPAAAAKCFRCCCM